MARVLEGLGVSVGDASGRVVSDLTDPNLPDGPLILVLHGVFDPVVVARAPAEVVGLIAHRGGLTSHAANIARERGLPCVVRVDCTQLADGTPVRVDGSQGVVDIK